MIASLSHLVTRIIGQFGYPGVFILMALESVNIPIPSEVIMPFSGFLAQQGVFSFWIVSIAGTLGNVAGSLLSYFLAEWIIRVRERSRLLAAVLSEKHLRTTNEWFVKYGALSVFFGRVVPVVRTFISLPAGLGKMNVVKFTTLTLVGSFIWSVFLTYVGFVLGSNWESIGHYFRQADYVVALCAVAVVAYLIYRHRSARRGSR